jgi:septal ring factor EnvC (AmiA/AmiB activator)
MKLKLAVVLLAIASIVLVGGLWYRHTVALESDEKNVATINQLSNEWKETSVKLDDQRKVNLTLEGELAARARELELISNNLASTSADLARTQTEAKAAMQAAEAEVKARDEKINQLEGERDDLTKRMTELNGSIDKLETQIADTERKLKASEGDREFLMNELKRLRAEKADLERRFQDLAVLREQVRKLRDELSISRRLEWIRRGIYGEIGKGAELLQRGFVVRAPVTNGVSPKGAQQFNLDVELRREGDATVKTNAPPGANPTATPPK